MESTLTIELPKPAAVSSMRLLGHVVVLFVMKDSLYKSLGLDCYDAERNALTYTGNNPVVAHPPCQLWGKMAKINHLRWGGDHNKPGNDGGCFRFALDTVNRCGGVLEHPAETYAWPAHGLPRPTTGWTRWKQGWVCEVWQSAYGHRANKRTWLYCSGTDAPLHPRWERPTGTHQVGFHDQRGKSANKPTLSKREANATPPAFAHYLLELAATCAKWPNDPHELPQRERPITMSLQSDIRTARRSAALRSMRLLGARVTRPIFLDDGTWMREGDTCLPRSPLHRGLVIKAERDEITVRWDDGKEQRLLSHGVDRENASAPNDKDLARRALDSE